MADEKIASHAVMEGQGAYNRHAKLPAGGAALALPLLEKAVRSVEVEPGEHAVVIADYGSSQGKNSMAPMHVATKGLRQRVGPSRPIWVFHVDQPSNDFNALFGVLDAGPDRYVSGDPNVFPAAIGRSFYGTVLPGGSVHLGWCSYAAMWLSRIPGPIPGHFLPSHATGEVRAEFDRQAAKDWEAFLTLRARELRPGGRLVAVLPGLADEGSSGFENIMDQANAVLAEMVAERAINSEERKRMVIGSHLRRKRELLAPFANNAHFQNLTVEDIEMFELADAVWADYERDENKEALATKHSAFFRSVFTPSLASALDRVRSGDGEALRAFGDRLERGLRQRLAVQLRPLHSFVQTLVLVKRV